MYRPLSNLPAGEQLTVRLDPLSARSADRRAAVLAAFHETQAALEDVAARVSDDPGDGELVALEDALFWRGAELTEAYLQQLPVRQISRCPFTHDPVTIRFDEIGLDGLWWSRTSAQRRTVSAPSTFAGLTGAVRLNGPVADAGFPVEPGPGAPFVIPEVLGVEGLTAVLSTMSVGTHTAYAIAYFSSPPPHPGLLAGREWGLFDGYQSELDFDLRPWIDRGKLAWIAPGDAALTLRSGSVECPYLSIEATHELQRIEGRAS
jgi:hypothetical protein